MPENTITQITLNSKYRVKFEKAASANKIDGFTVEAYDDSMEKAMLDAEKMYAQALTVVELNKPAPLPGKVI